MTEDPANKPNPFLTRGNLYMRKSFEEHQNAPTFGAVPPNEEPLFDDQSREFREWYEGSVLVKDGKPLALYHGTNQAFTYFDNSPGTLGDGPGIYFSREMVTVAGYGQNLYTCYVRMTCPKVVSSHGDTWFLRRAEREAFIRDGYDGLIWDPGRNADGSFSAVKWNGTEYVAFDPDQVRIFQRRTRSSLGFTKKRCGIQTDLMRTSLETALVPQARVLKGFSIGHLVGEVMRGVMDAKKGGSS